MISSLLGRMQYWSTDLIKANKYVAFYHKVFSNALTNINILYNINCIDKNIFV